MNPEALPYVLTAGFLFGTSLISTRFGLGFFSPVAFTGLRLILAALAFGVVYLAARRANPSI